MRFWDTSAIVPMLVSEESSDSILSTLRSDDRLIVWWGAHTECLSAIRRKERDGYLTADGANQSIRVLDRLIDGWDEIRPTEAVRAQAGRAISVHHLRASDAFQLGSALCWRPDPAVSREFVCLDKRLNEAARREGFACPLNQV